MRKMSTQCLFVVVYRYEFSNSCASAWGRQRFANLPWGKSFRSNSPQKLRRVNELAGAGLVGPSKIMENCCTAPIDSICTFYMSVILYINRIYIHIYTYPSRCRTEVACKIDFMLVWVGFARLNSLSG